MIKEINDMLERSRDFNPACMRYAYAIKSAKSKEEVFSTALDVQCIEFLCESVKGGWGISQEDIERVFKPYINGKYVRRGGYSSVMYCGFSGRVKALETVYCMIGCDAEIELEEPWRMCMVYVCGGGSVKVTGGGSARVYVYGDCDVTDCTGRSVVFVK